MLILTRYSPPKRLDMQTSILGTNQIAGVRKINTKQQQTNKKE
jgi:hypothetical protein